MKIRNHALILAALFATAPAAASAQTAVNASDPVYTQDEDDDGDEGKWGLLGLLGLAGLLGLKRRDPDHDHASRTTNTNR